MPGPPPEHPHLRLLKGNPGKRPGTLTEPLPPSCTGPPVVILSPNGNVGMPSKRPRFAAERGRNKREERRLDSRMLTVADVETLIGAALAVERQAVIPVIGEAVNELLDVEREHHKSELASTTRGLELQLAKLESAVSALQLAQERDNRKAILDLPN